MTDPVDYVAGPYTGDQAANVRAAIDTADKLAEHGMAPIVPHLSHFWDLVHPRPYEDWLRIDLAIVGRCDALYRMPDAPSPGADLEVKYALTQGVPVLYTFAGLHLWASVFRAAT